MLNKNEIIAESDSIGFHDIGFTSAEPFHDQRRLLESMGDSYEIFKKTGLDLVQGTDPENMLPGAKTIIVLLDNYFNKSYPMPLENNFGRCYLDDDRVTKDGLSIRIKKFRDFLRNHGIESKVPSNLPYRVAAARAGLGNYGKNCLFFSNKAAGKSSFVLPFAILIDHEFEPDKPSGGIGCPEWCRNACVAACPTRALKGDGTIDPKKCISYMTYFGREITPLESREPMGMYVYGCDICQNVCPRNRAWLAREMPINEKVLTKAPDFDLKKLLHMDREYFSAKIYPHMFYMSADSIWKWKMNTARVMGNSLDKKYVPDLIKAFNENDDTRVLGMIAWALGQIGGEESENALREFVMDEKLKNELMRKKNVIG